MHNNADSIVFLVLFLALGSHNTSFVSYYNYIDSVCHMHICLRCTGDTRSRIHYVLVEPLQKVITGDVRDNNVGDEEIN